jgi:secreted trypsin-like serine protease
LFGIVDQRTMPNLIYQFLPGHDASMVRIFAILIYCIVSSAAAAIVGGARQVAITGGPIVMILGARGNRGILCTGTALARDLVLTAAHCVAPDTSLRVMASRDATATPIREFVRHPRYDAESYAHKRVTADLALIKLAAPLPDFIAPVPLAVETAVTPGDPLLIAGFGVTQLGNDASTGQPHVATLVVTGRPGNLQIRLVDPATGGARFGLGGCVGDSGGPAFRDNGGKLGIVGVISWSTGPGESEGCGGLTGVTPVALHRAWILEYMAKKKE